MQNQGGEVLLTEIHWVVPGDLELCLLYLSSPWGQGLAQWAVLAYHTRSPGFHAQHQKGKTKKVLGASEMWVKASAAKADDLS